MRIAIFHNYYQLRGGEDVMFELECESLQKQGHKVLPYSIHNGAVISKSSPIEKAQIAWRTPHNSSSYNDISKFLKFSRPDVGHVHNWFPLFSPAIYEAHTQLGIPVIQTLHNYRLGCAAGTYRRKDAECTLCLTKSNWNAVKNRCYKGSLPGSYAWKRTVDRGWGNKIFTDSVTHYVSPSREVAERHISMGIPENKITIIPNACRDPRDGYAYTDYSEKPGSVIYLGRMVQEKGIDTLIEGWKLLPKSPAYSLPQSLTFIGDGPDMEKYRKATRDIPEIRFLGQLDHREAMKVLQSASTLVFPNRWAEPFGLGIIEAMATGRPVIASELGGPSEIIDNGVNGLLVPPNSPRAICKALCSLFGDTKKMKQMGEAARQKFLRHYQPSSHAHALTTLFESLNTNKIAC